MGKKALYFKRADFFHNAEDSFLDVLLADPATRPFAGFDIFLKLETIGVPKCYELAISFAYRLVKIFLVSVKPLVNIRIRAQLRKNGRARPYYSCI